MMKHSIHITRLCHMNCVPLPTFPAGAMLGIFLFPTASGQALKLTQPPIQWVPGALSPGANRPGREPDHTPPSSVGVKTAWRYTSIPQNVFMAWCLLKNWDNFTVTLPLPCHHGTARPRVVDGGDGLHIWTIAAKIFNKNSRAADKGWSFSLEGEDWGLTTPHYKQPACYEMLHKASDLGGFLRAT
jgi:hypothetical protein